MIKHRFFPTVFLILLMTWILSDLTVSGQEKNHQQKYVFSGYVRDDQDEELIGVNIYFPRLQKGCVSNEYGFYSITLPQGKTTFRISYIGFSTILDSIVIDRNISRNFVLNPVTDMIRDVEVHAAAKTILSSGRFQSIRIPMKMIESSPSLLGETDLIKTLQLLPGVLATNEGVSNFNVRGGNYDQNLILLDEATVFNPSHLMGFFSVFNADVVKDVRLYKGNLPAANGGRLSSVLDVRMREGNRERVAMRGGLGNIASRLTLDAPIAGKKGSILLAGRRSYADIFLPLSKNEEVKQNKIYFFDLNFKTNITVNDRNRIFLSGYSGQDDFTYKHKYYLNWGNYTTTLRWNHLYSQKLFSNFSLIYSRYNYRLGQTTKLTGVEWRSYMENLQGKYDFTWYLTPGNTLRFGITSSRFHFSPGLIRASDTLSVYNNYTIPGATAWENAAYIEEELNISKKLTLEAGLRGVLFLNVGKATVYHFNNLHETIDSTVYPAGMIFNTYPALEPRIGLTWTPDSTLSFSGSYSYTRQFIHLISNTTAGTPLDIWIPSDPNIRPQYAHQFSVGLQKNVSRNYVITADIYYKLLGAQIDYKDHANLLLNPELTGELRFGKAKARGIELMIRKDRGRLKGWISYTWSRAIREIPEINGGKAYPASYDRPQDLAVVGIYDLSPRWHVSLSWIYQSGAPVTFPVGRYVFDNVVVPEYSDRNAYRLPVYHRMDFSVTLLPRPERQKRFHSEWNFSVYNLYNRKNAWMIYFQANRDDPGKTEAYKLYMFPVIPSITWNFIY
ncbi:MAG: TonB-dependent receptor [Chlorobi bacterium]|nr:TonB-dependent receptor [Chlorobiota bacterium]